jgi:hypothetical protein
MNSKVATLSAAMGLTLLAGAMTPAAASIVGAELRPVHSEERNIRYCDHRSRMRDYMPGGRLEQPTPAVDLEDGVVFEQVSLLSGKTMYTDRFDIDAAGTYQVTLTDFDFPNPLKMAGLNITSATDSLGSLLEPGSLTFDADPGSYYLSFFGKADRLGQFGIQVAQLGVPASNLGTSAVPVPAAAWLFGSGLIGLAGFIRRNNA